MNNNILEIEHLKKVYHTKQNEILALEDVSFKVKNKELVSIIGPSGCGKSTILGILSFLVPKSGGTVKFYKDKPVIGYMLQTDALFPWKSVYENCLLGLKIRKEETKENVLRVEKLLKKYDLWEFKDNYPDSLSGGMRQRVALIRTLAIDPDILFLDEPFSKLDYQTRLALSNDIYNIIKKEGKTAIMVTHDIAEAISMSDRIIILSKRPGKVKKIEEIKLKGKNPIENRKDPLFLEYHDKIWRQLDEYL